MRKWIFPQVTHIMADGKVLTHEEFMAQPYTVVAEDNLDFHIKCNQVFDPNYYAKEHLRRKYMLAERRRAELNAQAAEIAAQLSDLRENGASIT